MPDSSSFCNLCGRLLQGGGWRYDHPQRRARPLIVCDHCHQSLPHCPQCGLPMRPDRAVDGLCALCAAAAPRCRSCGRAIGPGYIEVNGQGPYCPTCYETRPRCDVCAAPLDDRAQRLPDGRIICSTCQQTAVIDPAQARALFERVEGIIQDTLRIDLRIGVRFVVTDRPGLRVQVDKMRPDLKTQADQVLGVYVREGDRRTIYMQNGLPCALMAQTAAHEWAHAWQAETCPEVADALTVEGFAEWLAFKVLHALGAADRVQVMLARQDVYGQGLRRMLEYEAQAGVSGVLTACSIR